MPLIKVSNIPTTSIADSAITSSKIASGTITSGNIADGTITATDLHTTAVTDKLGFTPASTGKAIAMSIVFGG
jgi:hypothetical protein